MQVNKTALQAALEKCLPGLDKSSDIFYIDTDVISTSNALINVNVPFDFDEDMKFAVKADDLYNLLKKFSMDEIDLSIKDNKIIVKNGKAKATLSILNQTMPSTWPTILPVSYVNLPDNFMSMLERCYIPNNTTQMSGIYILEGKMCSTDLKKFNVCTLSEPMPMMWLNDQTVKALLKQKAHTRYFLRAGVISFRTDDGSTLNSRGLNAENYPIKVVEQYVGLIENSDAVEVELPETLVDVIKRASPLAEKTVDGSFVSLEFTLDGVKIVTETSGNSYEELCEFDCELEAPAIFLDYKHCLYGLSRGTKAKIITTTRSNNELTILVLTNEQSLHILATAT